MAPLENPRQRRKPELGPEPGGRLGHYGGQTFQAGLVAFNQQRSHNAVHELESITDAENGNAVTAVEHDPEGNITRDDRGFTYAYDFDNQLAQANNASGEVLGRYEYDALGRRTQRTASDPAAGSTVTTTYVCLTDTSGMGQVISEYDEGELVRQSTYGSYIDEPLTLHVKSGSGASQTYWYHQDRRYNIVGLSDDSGDVVERYAYTPYGERRVLDPDGGTERSASDFGNARAHQGLWHDDESELIYNRARYRSTSLGRWMGRDPLGYVDGASVYQYLQSRIGSYLDPTGKACCKGKSFDTDTHCCQKGKVVSKVAIWVCQRPIAGAAPGTLGADALEGAYLLLTWITPKPLDLSHSYVCCDGPNKNCYGKQSFNKAGDLIPRETNTVGSSCKKRLVCPSVKRSKCSSPRALTDYSIPKAESCHAWAWRSVDYHGGGSCGSRGRGRRR